MRQHKSLAAFALMEITENLAIPQKFASTFFVSEH
jgi:hypothetical protein